MNTLTNLTDVEIEEILYGTVDGVYPTSQETAMARELKSLRAQLADLRGYEPVSTPDHLSSPTVSTLNKILEWDGNSTEEHTARMLARELIFWRSAPLYAAPVPPAVPDELLAALEEVIRISDRDHDAWHRAKAEIQSYRALHPNARPVPTAASQPNPVATLDVQSGRPDGKKFSLVYLSAAHELPDDVYYLYTEPQSQSERQPYTVPDDYFSSLVSAARTRADKAMRKFPQPNYVLNKVAEESGEVIKAVIHYTEGREEWSNVEEEIVDNLAMLIRLVTEGDQVIGFTPPEACRASTIQLFGNSEQVNSTVVPDGWALVPIEPTEAMLLVLGMTGSFDSMIAQYQKALAAAPQHKGE